jgi:hypothetical protein
MPGIDPRLSVPDTLVYCISCCEVMPWTGRQYECLVCSEAEQKAAYERMTGHSHPCDGYNPNNPCTCGKRR